MTKPQLLDFLKLGFDEIVTTSQQAEDEHFFIRPAENVWSAAENVQHLTQSVQPLVYLMQKPKSYLADKWGKTDWQGRSYEQIVHLYEGVLAQGLKATGNFVPVLETATDKNTVMGNFQATHNQLLIVANDWTEEDLDTYIIPHPVMRNMSVREMLYFTAFHTRHHHDIMQERLTIILTKP